MNEMRTCSACGKRYEANPWSFNSGLCYDCVKTGVRISGRADQPGQPIFPGKPVPEAGESGEDVKPADWVVRPPTKTIKKPTQVRGRETGVVVREETGPGRGTGRREPAPRAPVFSSLEAPAGRRPGRTTGVRARSEVPAPLDCDAGHPPIFKDASFWIVLAMGVMPILINAIANPVYRLTAMLFFFALLWGGVFQGFVMRSRASLFLPLLAFFFTGIVGLFVLLTLYAFLPPAYMLMSLSDAPLVNLAGQVFQVGVCEEACKLLPVVIYLFVKGKDGSVEMAILIGIFSGLGFAAFENIQYSKALAMSTISDVYAGSKYGGLKGALEGAGLGAVQVMGGVLLRALSVVFLHAVFSGISACVFTESYFRDRNRLVAVLAALLPAAFLHGIYNWLNNVQSIFSGLTIAASFTFLYTYLRVMRSLDARIAAEQETARRLVAAAAAEAAGDRDDGTIT